MQINRDNTRENKNRVEYDYKVGDKFMLTKHRVITNGAVYEVSYLYAVCLVSMTLSPTL